MLEQPELCARVECRGWLVERECFRKHRQHQCDREFFLTAAELVGRSLGKIGDIEHAALHFFGSEPEADGSEGDRVAHRCREHTCASAFWSTNPMRLRMRRSIDLPRPFGPQR